jgi:hypothetical protein
MFPFQAYVIWTERKVLEHKHRIRKPARIYRRRHEEETKKEKESKMRKEEEEKVRMKIKKRKE